MSLTAEKENAIAFQEAVTENKNRRFRRILTEEDVFEVWQDKSDGSFYYCTIEADEFATVQKVREVAAISQEVMPDPNPDLRTLANALNCTCVGYCEKAHTYAWFL